MSTEMAAKIAGAVAGLRELADFIEQHPDLPWSSVAFDADSASATLLTPVDDVDEIAAFARSGGRWEKSGTDAWFNVSRTFGPFKVEAYAPRGAVCERVVVGTETVEIPDPEAPKVTVKREIVEWVCSPLLAEREEAVA